MWGDLGGMYPRFESTYFTGPAETRGTSLALAPPLCVCGDVYPTLPHLNAHHEVFQMSIGSA